MSERKFSVYVTAMLESHRITYWVHVDNGLPRQAGFQRRGQDHKMSVIQRPIFMEAWSEAEVWAAFLGCQVEPFVKPKWHDREVQRFADLAKLCETQKQAYARNEAKEFIEAPTLGEEPE